MKTIKNFIRNLPNEPSFKQNGLKGSKYPLENQNLEIYFIESQTGHDNKVYSQTLTHCYYILEGSGVFTINDQEYRVAPKEIIEIPPKNQFTFKGQMKLLLIMEPPFSSDKIKIIK